jgi:hypothetical protein
MPAKKKTTNHNTLILDLGPGQDIKRPNNDDIYDYQ